MLISIIRFILVSALGLGAAMLVSNTFFVFCDRLGGVHVLAAVGLAVGYLLALKAIFDWLFRQLTNIFPGRT